MFLARNSSAAASGMVLGGGKSPWGVALAALFGTALCGWGWQKRGTREAAMPSSGDSMHVWMGGGQPGIQA